MSERVDGRRVRGEATRRAVIEATLQLASTDGLEGVSLSRVASAAGMSKSGLFAHFGSKEELQLAVLRAARERLEAAVEPAYEARKGIVRLHALMDEWLGFLAGGAYEGGDPLLSAATDQAARPGPVRDLAAETGAWWLGELRAQAERALERGELRTGGDAARLAWELHAYGLAYDWDRRLTGADPAQARAAVEERLEGAATGKGRKRLAGPGAR